MAVITALKFYYLIPFVNPLATLIALIVASVPEFTILTLSMDGYALMTRVASSILKRGWSAVTRAFFCCGFERPYNFRVCVPEYERPPRKHIINV